MKFAKMPSLQIIGHQNGQLPKNSGTVYNFREFYHEND